MQCQATPWLCIWLCMAKGATQMCPAPHPPSRGARCANLIRTPIEFWPVIWPGIHPAELNLLKYFSRLCQSPCCTIEGCSLYSVSHEYLIYSNHKSINGPGFHQIAAEDIGPEKEKLVVFVTHPSGTGPHPSPTG